MMFPSSSATSRTWCPRASPGGEPDRLRGRARSAVEAAKAKGVTVVSVDAQAGRRFVGSKNYDAAARDALVDRRQG